MRGRFSQADAYLRGETKDKPIGEVMSGKEKPCFRRHRFTSMGKIGDYKCVEEFCTLCNSAKCRGCCPGCKFCDESIPEEFEGQREMYIKGLERQRKFVQDKKKSQGRVYKDWYGVG